MEMISKKLEHQEPPAGEKQPDNFEVAKAPSPELKRPPSPDKVVSDKPVEDESKVDREKVVIVDDTIDPNGSKVPPPVTTPEQARVDNLNTILRNDGLDGDPAEITEEVIK